MGCHINHEFTHSQNKFFFLEDKTLGMSITHVVRYCHFGVSPVNYSDSDSDVDCNHQLASPQTSCLGCFNVPLLFLRAFMVLPMVPMVDQYRSRFYQWYHW